jgi:hypothetical protein
MKKLISIKLASNIMITINTIALLMHVLIHLKLLPHDFVWVGRLKSAADLIIFESISIVVQTLFISIVAVKAGYIFKGKFKRTVDVGTWEIFGLMVLNTIGNSFKLWLGNNGNDSINLCARTFGIQISN